MIWGYHYFRKHPYAHQKNDGSDVQACSLVVLGGVSKATTVWRGYQCKDYFHRNGKAKSPRRCVSGWTFGGFFVRLEKSSGRHKNLGNVYLDDCPEYNMVLNKTWRQDHGCQNWFSRRQPWSMDGIWGMLWLLKSTVHDNVFLRHAHLNRDFLPLLDEQLTRDQVLGWGIHRHQVISSRLHRDLW